MRRVQVVVCGSVAVIPIGARLGKDAGDSDIEVALLTGAGLIGPGTVIVTTIDPLQVVEGPLPETGHDFRVDLIAGLISSVSSARPRWRRASAVIEAAGCTRCEDDPAAVAREPTGPANRPSSEMITMRWFGPQARWLLATVALVLVSASCGVRTGGTGSAQPSGPVTLISGVVEARPGCPVERPGRLCKPRPLGDVRVEARFLPAGETVSARTGADGHYSFRLGKGRYVLVAVTRQVLPRCPHVFVSVTSPAPVRANINCDSGIR
jgi:hypothetical protein